MGGPSKAKCEGCRDRKKKCEPENRRWDENGVKERCTLCVAGDSPCGPGIKLKPPSKSSPSRQREHETRRMADSGVGSHTVEGTAYSVGGDVDVKSEKRLRLNEKVLFLDCYEELFKQSSLTIEYLKTTNAQLQPLPLHPHKDQNCISQLSHVQAWAKERLHVTLAEIRHLAASVAENKDLEAVERAYARAINIFRSPPFDSTDEYVELLQTTVSFHIENGDHLQAEKHLSLLFRVPHLSVDVKACAIQQLNESMRHSTKHISETFQFSDIGRLMRHIQVPFPESHRLMTAVPPSTSITSAIMSFEQREPDMTGSPIIHSAIASENEHVFGMIEACPREELLESRDSYRRTALFLAAMYKEENVGGCILARFAEYPTDRFRLMNDRDIFGNTILAISIMSNCSAVFVKALIDNGSKVEPLEIKRDSFTPLRAAALMGRLDIIEILQGFGARDHKSPIGNLDALQLARIGGHDDIVERLSLAS